MAKVGIIGTGWGTRVQVPRFREAGLDVRAIYGRSPEKTRAEAAKSSIPEVHEDWRDLLRSDIDLVTIVTPPFQHLEMASAALEAGLHVVSEKPTALNGEEARQLLELSRRHPDRIALVDHELRFLPSTRRAREMVQDLGEIHWIGCTYSSPSRNDLERGWNWWSDESKGGGVIGAIGSHLIDACRHLVGEVNGVSATLKTFIESRPDGSGQRKEVTSDDFASLTLSIEGGVTAAMTMSVVSGVDEPTTITIHGLKGALRLIQDKLFFARTGDDWKPVEVEHTGEGAGDSPGGSFGSGTYWLGKALARAIDEGDRSALEPAATFHDGLIQQLVLDAARRSSRNRGAFERIDLPDQK